MVPTTGGGMAGETGTPGRVDTWGPVCRGFHVLLPDGQRGSVQDVRMGNDGVELLVETGLFVRRGLVVRVDDIEAILPGASQILVRESRGAAAEDVGGEVETAGGIVRMPPPRSSRIGSPPRKAA